MYDEVDLVCFWNIIARLLFSSSAMCLHWCKPIFTDFFNGGWLSKTAFHLGHGYIITSHTFLGAVYKYHSHTLMAIYLNHYCRTWWRYQMETFSALLAICAGNSPVSGEFPAQRPVTRFDVFFDLRLNKRLSKHWWGWWFETPSWSLWRQCNDMGKCLHPTKKYMIDYNDALCTIR